MRKNYFIAMFWVVILVANGSSLYKNYPRHSRYEIPDGSWFEYTVKKSELNIWKPSGSIVMTSNVPSHSFYAIPSTILCVFRDACLVHCCNYRISICKLVPRTTSCYQSMWSSSRLWTEILKRTKMRVHGLLLPLSRRSKRDTLADEVEESLGEKTFKEPAEDGEKKDEKNEENSQAGRTEGGEVQEDSKKVGEAEGSEKTEKTVEEDKETKMKEGEGAKQVERNELKDKDGEEKKNKEESAMEVEERKQIDKDVKEKKNGTDGGTTKRPVVNGWRKENVEEKENKEESAKEVEKRKQIDKDVKEKKNGTEGGSTKRPVVNGWRKEDVEEKKNKEGSTREVEENERKGKDDKEERDEEKKGTTKKTMENERKTKDNGETKSEMKEEKKKVKEGRDDTTHSARQEDDEEVLTKIQKLFVKDGDDIVGSILTELKNRILESGFPEKWKNIVKKTAENGNGDEKAIVQLKTMIRESLDCPSFRLEIKNIVVELGRKLKV